MQQLATRTYQYLSSAIEHFANSTTSVKQQENFQNKLPYIPVKSEYASVDKIHSILSSSIVRRTLQAISDKYYFSPISRIIQSTKVASNDNYPTLMANYQKCCQKLRITDPPCVYVTSDIQGINALSVQCERQTLILVSPQVALLPDAELCFLLGHELGHCQQGHITAHVVIGLLHSMREKSELFAPLLEDAVCVPLKQWFRDSEFTADRAGMACCENMESVYTLFCRLGMKQQVLAYESFLELEATSPLLATRYNELKKLVSR